MTAAEILKSLNLNRTHCRVLVLEQLMNSNKALSHQEIDNALRPLCNRSTLYRILGTLEEKGILLRVVIDENNKYFFDASLLEKTTSPIDFVFFHCTRCHDVLPLQPVKQEGIRLPEGFVMKGHNFVIKGHCKHCNHENFTI